MQNYTIGRGKVYFSLLKSDGVTPVGFRYVGNSPGFALGTAVEKLAHYSSDGGIREKDRDGVIQVDSSATLQLDDIQPENLALFFLGSTSTIAQTSAGSQAYTLVDVVPGTLYQIGATSSLPTGVRNLASVVVTVGGSSKTLGTDYTLDVARGTITILEGGTIAKDDDVAVTYSRGTGSRTQVVSGNNQVAGSILYVADNPEGENYDWVLPNVKLTPDGEFALKTDNDWQILNLNVEILKAPGLQRVYIDATYVDEDSGLLVLTSPIDGAILTSPIDNSILTGI